VWSGTLSRVLRILDSGDHSGLSVVGRMAIQGMVVESSAVKLPLAGQSPAMRASLPALVAGALYDGLSTTGHVFLPRLAAVLPEDSRLGRIFSGPQKPISDPSAHLDRGAVDPGDPWDGVVVRRTGDRGGQDVMELDPTLSQKVIRHLEKSSRPSALALGRLLQRILEPAGVSRFVGAQPGRASVYETPASDPVPASPYRFPAEVKAGHSTLMPGGSTNVSVPQVYAQPASDNPSPLSLEFPASRGGPSVMLSGDAHSTPFAGRDPGHSIYDGPWDEVIPGRGIRHAGCREVPDDGVGIYGIRLSASVEVGKGLKPTGHVSLMIEWQKVRTAGVTSESMGGDFPMSPDQLALVTSKPSRIPEVLVQIAASQVSGVALREGAFFIGGRAKAPFGRISLVEVAYHRKGKTISARGRK